MWALGGLNWAGYLREYSGRQRLCGETQENSGAREHPQRAGRKNEGEPSTIPPWLPEHLCKHCGVQSKAGAAGLAHTCEREEKGLSVICPAQESTIAQDTQGKKILNEVSAHKNLRELLAESTTILSMCSLYGPEGQSLNSQGPKNHNTIPRLKAQGPFVSSGTEDFTQQCGQISIMPGH